MTETVRTGKIAQEKDREDTIVNVVKDVVIITLGQPLGAYTHTIRDFPSKSLQVHRLL